MGNRTSTVQAIDAQPTGNSMPSPPSGRISPTVPMVAHTRRSVKTHVAAPAPVLAALPVVAHTRGFIHTDIPGLSTSQNRRTPMFAALPAVGTHFKTTRRLGKGAFSRVYAVEYAGEERAAKIYRAVSRLAECAEAEREALLEVESSGLFLRCHGTYACRGHMILMIELAVCDLYAHRKAVLQGNGVADSVKAVATSLFSGLAHLHARGIIHTDIKPENVLRVRRGTRLQLVISDLGSVMRGTSQYTRHGDITSSWYRAPELYLSGNFGTPIDVWSAGCVVYEHATGTPLFHHSSAYADVLETTHTALFEVHEEVLGACPLENYEAHGPAPWLAERVARPSQRRRVMPRVAHAGVTRMLELVLRWETTERPTASHLAAEADVWPDYLPVWSIARGTSRRQQAVAQVAASYP